MLDPAVLKNFQDFDPWRGDLQTKLSQVTVLQWHNLSSGSIADNKSSLDIITDLTAALQLPILCR